MPYTHDPANVPRDAVRLLVGDTNPLDELLTDTEYDYLIGSDPDNINTYAVAADAADAIAAKFSRQVDTRNEGLDVKASQRSKQYSDLANILRDQAASDPAKGGGAEIYVGGAYRDAKKDLDESTDLTQPSFRFGQDDVPGNYDDH